jgi:mannose-6-phosphate isomerase-like protein (cupin superfamily)
MVVRSLRRGADGCAPELQGRAEQFTVIIEGEMHFVLGDEDRVVGPGTLVHIPRNTRHRSRPVNGPATFLTVKSPAGDGNLDQDYQRRPEAEEIEALDPGNKM